MKSIRILVAAVLTAATAIPLTGCGGGGGGGGGGAGVATATPTIGRNSAVVTNTNGTTILTIDELEFFVGETTDFTVELRNLGGGPVVGAEVRFSSGSGIQVTNPASGVATTDANGRVTGTLLGAFNGAFSLQAIPSAGLPPVTLSVRVFGGGGVPTLTPTEGGMPGPTITPTVVPVVDVARIIVQAEPFSVASSEGGTVNLTILAFDENNIGVSGVRVLLEANPGAGTSFSPRTPITDFNGQATSAMTIQDGTTVGTITVTAVAGSVSGEVPVQVVAASGGGQPVDRVKQVIVQLQPASISSALGGTITVTTRAFDENNVGVPAVRMLLDTNPRAGTSFEDQTPVTNATGVATSTLRVQPGASVGQITVSASAGEISGSSPVTVVSGVSQRPVATVVLETDQPTIGADSGGTASLRARVLDADNVGIPDVNVLFLTDIGQVNPAVEVSCGGTVRPCPPAEIGLAQTTLIVPPNAITREYRIQALAGGVNGGTTISIVPGRGGTGTGNPNAAAGQTASITLGASPGKIQVAGTGGTSQSTIIARVFDNNNNPLTGATVALRVVPDLENGARMLPLSQPTPEPGSQVPTPVPPAKCLENADRAQALAEGKLALGVSDRAGFVLASVIAGTISGSVTIEACADSINNDSSVTAVVESQPVVVVGAGPPETVTVSVNNLFVDNNDGTLLTTVAAIVKDRYGNIVEDGTSVFFSIANRDDVGINGGVTTNQTPPCDTSQFVQQTGVPVTAQPGTAITCMTYPKGQSGSIVRVRAESGGVSNEDNQGDDEEFPLPPGSRTGPATGTPSARNFSMASQFLNLSGRVTFGLTSTITAYVLDRSGNPASRNTLVHFTTDFGGITSQNTTDQVGRTTATVQTSGALPPDGVVTVTATVRGEEDFNDVDGDGEFDPEVDQFVPALHDQDGDGQWSADAEISTSIRLLFTGPTQIEITARGFPDMPFEVQAGSTTCFDATISDDLANPLVGGSTVKAQTSGGLDVLGLDSATIPDTNRRCSESLGACTFSFCISASPTLADVTPVAVTVIVESSGLPAGGNGSVAQTITGLAIPAATP